MTREMRFSERNTNLFGFPSVSILSKYVADIPQLSVRGILTGTATRVLGGNQGVQPYKYGTKELDRQNGLDWYDSKARMYDPLLGRTPTMDPLAEKYYPISPYAWCAGNSIRIVDVDGVALRLLDNYKDGAMYVAQIAATSYGGMIIDKLIGNQFTTTHPCRLVAHRRRLRPYIFGHEYDF